MSKRFSCNRIVPSTLYRRIPFIEERDRRTSVRNAIGKESRLGRGAERENGCRGKSTRAELSVFKIPMRLRGFAFSSSREKKAALDARECGKGGTVDRGCRVRPKRW